MTPIMIAYNTSGGNCHEGSRPTRRLDGPAARHVPSLPGLLPLGMAALLLCGAARANDALDILEGHKDVADVDLPPDPAKKAESAPLVMPPTWGAEFLDPIWARAVLFSDPQNPWVQQVAIQGLFEWSGIWGNVKSDVPPSGVQNKENVGSLRARRMRLGARVRAFCNTDIEARVELTGDSAYSGIDELKATFEVSPDTKIGVGKMRPRFSYEYGMDPSRLITPERSALVDQLAPARTLGIMVDSHCGNWDYGLGWFSSDADQNLPGWSGSGFLLAKIAYEETGKSVDRARWHLDYIYNMNGRNSQSIPRLRVPVGARSANGNQPVAQPWFRQMVSTGVEVEQGRFGCVADFLLGNGGEANVWGLTIMPSYWLMPGTLQLVGRYHYADTDTPGGIVTGLGRDPFFDSSPLYVGDEYNSFYLGANWHLYQDQILLMSGLEYATLKDQSGGGFDTDFLLWHAAARIGF